jgi:hypothetical protein
MASTAIDTYKLLTTLKATGKDANYSAEELANAFRVAQEGSEILTKPVFDATMGAISARFDAFDAKLEFLRADIRAEVKSSQLQNLLWLSGITLAGNGVIIAMLARATRLF